MIKKSPLNKIGRKHKERIADWRSETTTFKIKWLRNYGKTDLTGKYFPIENVQSFQFAHALPKWMFPEYRNNPNNIIYVDNIEQHERLDSITAGNKYLVESLVIRWDLVQRVKARWRDFLIQKRHNETSTNMS